MFPDPVQTRARERAIFDGNPGMEAATLAEAGLGLARVLACHFPTPGTLFVFAGSGHNGADALLGARHLLGKEWKVEACLMRTPGKSPAPATTAAMEALTQDGVGIIGVEATPNPSLPRPWVVLDGLCGIGARLPLEGDSATAARTINRLREYHGASVVAVDMPSGLDGSTGEATEPCVTADLTVTMAVVKRGLVLAPASTGRLALLPIASLPIFQAPGEPEECLVTSEMLGPWLPPRPHDLHKGTAGKIAIIAGSPGMTGAPALAAMGAMHGGAGLVHVFCSPDSLDEVAKSCPPEIMVRPWPKSGLASFPGADFDAIAIGPGIGRQHDASLPGFVRHCPVPLLIDADALNGLALQSGQALPFMENPPAGRLITPHPGEFARLAPDLAGLPRPQAAQEFSRRFPGCTLLLKGPRTIVSRHGAPVAYNQTGNSGLASGGSGDVLAGLGAALLARLSDPWMAGCAAAWLHGRAAELAIKNGNETTESLLASTTARFLGPSWLSLRQRDP
ncbi:MAG: NAD(P)H-hydrate dehydratase [Verrucomicrobiales bacterium]